MKDTAKGVLPDVILAIKWAVGGTKVVPVTTLVVLPPAAMD
ncbi:MAG: hypothetical protein ABR887_03180 [Methanoregulaceae archaeon]